MRARVVRGPEASQARRVTELFYVSFGRRLAGLVLPRDEEAGIELRASSLCLDEVYAAEDAGGRALGIAVVTGHGRALCLDREALVRAYGRPGGEAANAAFKALPGARRSPTRERHAAWRGSRSIRHAAGAVSGPP